MVNCVASSFSEVLNVGIERRQGPETLNKYIYICIYIYDATGL